MKKCLLCFALIVLLTLPTLAQDEPVENFGRILVSFDLGIDDDDFGSARHIVAQSDLSQYYVTGGDGLVYVYDAKGNLQTTWETGVDNIIDDLAIDLDHRLYVAQGGSIYIFNDDGTVFREIPGSLVTQHYTRIAMLDDGTFYAVTFLVGIHYSI